MSKSLFFFFILNEINTVRMMTMGSIFGELSLTPVSHKSTKRYINKEGYEKIVSSEQSHCVFRLLQILIRIGKLVRLTKAFRLLRLTKSGLFYVYIFLNRMILMILHSFHPFTIMQYILISPLY